MSASPVQPMLPDRPRGSVYAREGREHGKSSSYANLTIQADAPDVHEKALRLSRTHASARESVLDIAAGTGALSQRLLDNGFSGLEAIELCAERFAVPGVPVHSVNLDGPWSDQLTGRFEAAVALEIIEHLENPWHFARECAKALRPGGVLVVTTPNI
jgi:2-polyprenyl-3-methyl-5-hydroxy-6-metoxy-1,4-benzoquinol methylase